MKAPGLAGYMLHGGVAQTEISGVRQNGKFNFAG